MTRNEPVKWTVDSFKSFLNELENVKSLLQNETQGSVLNSPGVITKIVARLPKRTKDELTKLLCNAGIHIPEFNFL